MADETSDLCVLGISCAFGMICMIYGFGTGNKFGSSLYKCHLVSSDERALGGYEETTAAVIDTIDTIKPANSTAWVFLAVPVTSYSYHLVRGPSVSRCPPPTNIALSCRYCTL